MATSPSNRRTGTGFVNLADWSRANAGASNSLANRLAGDVQQQGEAVQRGLGNLQSQFRDAADAGEIRYEDPEGLERADYLSRMQYAGPRGLSDVGGVGAYDALLGRADAAERAANRVGDYYGRQAQLQGLFGQTGAYTPGQQRLDSALSGIAGAERFGQLQSRWGNLYGQAQQADAMARTDAAERTTASEAAAQRYGKDAEAYRARQQQAEREVIGRQAEEDAAADVREREERRRQREWDRQRNRGNQPENRVSGGKTNYWGGLI